ncbi:hypothetical protein I8D64_05420 [Brachybacterium sp. MASK1Z-5]|uniref:Uncharacterized protein n=1 Tax=Brachybacterium halotolerans TaxID=2795215 RepID=A0ABS1B872_9MICO|nr:hypothetical protein [Brachybacterium halotolerans]MBK0330838.1 hypothetical protein [Brachybacterium halotolerans]
MIIWRGWGILAVLYIGALIGLLVGGLGAGVLRFEGAMPLMAGVALLLGGAITTLHGWYVNITAPRSRATAWALEAEPKMQAAAQAGAFAIDGVMPRSREEADAMIDAEITRGRAVIGRHGPHSLFFVPMEAIGILAMVSGLGFLGVGVFRTIMG